MSSVIVKVTENGSTKSVVGETVKEAMGKIGFIPSASSPQEVFESVTVGEVING